MSSNQDSSAGNIDPDLYDCSKLFPLDLSNYYTSSGPVASETRTWIWKSWVTTGLVGTLSKFWIKVLNTAQVHHLDRLKKALHERNTGVPLITVTNHHSCMDEPLLWGILSLRDLWDQALMRWVFTAHDVCFTNKRHSLFFSYGKSVPIVRGAGVYQQGVKFTSDRLNDGLWAHVYPEGKVNVTKADVRLKWGVGQLISDCKRVPVVLPIYHFGMDDVLPNKLPYIPLVGKRVTIVVGEPIEVGETLQELRQRNATDEEKRKVITDLIQAKMAKLKLEAQIRHAKHIYGAAFS